MESFRELEGELKVKLKKVCDVTGKEINPQESAPIFNKMGLLYQRQSPNKIRLIQSAALLNAALVRQKNNQKFQNDLDQLCRHVLICANAERKNASLRKIAETVKTRVEPMRKYTHSHLQVIKRLLRGKDKLSQAEYTKHVKCLQRNVSESYRNIMVFVSRQCIFIMGRPQCDYALVGMGSVARNEITPYSDFEHIVVLENGLGPREDLKEYFRWYSTIFHIIIINLGETDLYSMCIPCLSDHFQPQGKSFYDKFTPEGISFDGMMPHACHFPLGKTQKSVESPWTTELIKPIDEMVKYLEVKEDLKDGYNLNNILTSTCLIEGNDIIHKQFASKIKSVLRQNTSRQRVVMMKQLEKDFQNCNLTDKLEMFAESNSVDIKRIVYRSITLFVSALGRLHGLNVNSSFNIIQELLTRNLIGEDAASCISHAVAVACHIRLFFYQSKRRRYDQVENELWGKEKADSLMEVVSKSNLIQCLATSRCFQVSLKQTILSSSSFYFMWKMLKDDAVEIQFFVALGLYEEAIERGEMYLEKCSAACVDMWTAIVMVSLGDAYCRVQKYQKCIDMCNMFEFPPAMKPFLNRFKLNKLISLFHLGQYQNVVDETDAELKSLRGISFVDSKPSILSDPAANSSIELVLADAAGIMRAQKKIDFLCYLLINGWGKLLLQNFYGAIISFRDALKVYKQLKFYENYSDIKYFLLQLGTCICLRKLGFYESALHLARESLNYVEKVGFVYQFQDWFTDIIHRIETDRIGLHKESSENRDSNSLCPKERSLCPIQ